jgi:hypothetical protein
MHAAKATKQDEFNTQLSDIDKELRLFTKHFKNKTVLCNPVKPNKLVSFQSPQLLEIVVA